ncbi:NTP transferase domain-containing protein [Planctomyces sp. SH-PL62]|uniref:NTP transferase domain-containing protein n=1 Tax=Planctomyces sp. SH-PL62 TaxID=1636152 RepID=UPI00078E733D|nr:NTP transferase domain-containing protein [Planctomyces sp. SH-PL62]AMV39544.1 Nicotine blue oxidoreductase [Planctomyces sp. SH-PL62]
MSPIDPTIAAIVPAAGASLRMGRPKLLLEFGGRPLIARVVEALLAAGAQPVVVVAPPEDAPEGPAIIQAAVDAGADVIVPESRPATMRESVELAVVELGWSEDPPAGFLLTPADSPRLDASLVGRLIAAWRERPDRIVAPTFDGRRGHPIILPWRLALEIADLSPDEGVNALVAEYASEVDEIAFESDAILVDLDTPEDLRRLEDSPAAGTTTRTVRLFAIARQLAGSGEVVVSLDEPATVADLRRALVEQHPALGAIAERVRIAVDDEYADDAAALRLGVSLALIPPVSGGGG